MESSKHSKARPVTDHALQVTAEYIRDTLAAVKDESLGAKDRVEAAEEALSMFRSAIDAGIIFSTVPGYQQLAKHVAECIWRYENDGAALEDAFRVSARRGAGQPKGTKKVNESSYAALLILLERELGSANKAKSKVLELEEDLRTGKTPISKRTLDTIYAEHEPLRDGEHDLLVVMLTRRHRKLFEKTLR